MKDVNVGSPDKSTKSESAEVWDLSQERAFIENLLCQRFNFLLVFYSLVVAGAFTANSQRNFNIVLTIGAIVSSMFALPIARAHHKLELILRHLGTRHPARMTDVWASDLSLVPTVMRPFVRYSRRDVNGTGFHAVHLDVMDRSGSRLGRSLYSQRGTDHFRR